MRLIPGKTKVKIELFRGITLADIIVGLVGLGIVALCSVSSLPGRWIIAGVVAAVFIMLLVRIEETPLYIFFWNMLKYLSYPRRFYRVYDDAALKRMSKGDRAESMEYFYDEKAEDAPAEEVSEQKQKEKQDLKEIIREENKILKSKTATKEEKDAVWMARAMRSAERKKAKQKKKEGDSEYQEINEFMPFTGIKDNVIEYAGKYYGGVIEINPVEFRFFSTRRRNNSIETCLGRVLRGQIGEYGSNIVKIQHPIIYDEYLEAEYRKLDDLKMSYESGLLSEEELKARVEIQFDRIQEIEALCGDEKVIEPFYYLVLFESDKRRLEINMRQAISSLEQGELPVHRLDTRELAVFLKYTNTLDFDEKEIDQIDEKNWLTWALPERVKFTARRTEVNGVITHNLRVISFPSVVGDAWLAGVMSIPGTKVVVKTTPMDREKAVRSIDRSLSELRGQYANTGIDSKRIELQSHIETLSSLLVTLQQDNESLYSVNVYITGYDVIATREDPLLKEKFPEKTMLPAVAEMKKTIRRSWGEAGMKLTSMDFLQLQAFIGAQISAYDPMLREARGIPSNTIAAMYPWIYAHISDKGGVKLGSSDGVPVFINFFRRDAERVNSNMVIIGKSGSGKSYTTKSLLLNLAAEDSKIFILDPENEYSEMANTLHGKIINVGNARYGRLNPFQIITALDDDEAGEGGGGPAGSFATHLQFLEEFFRQILPDIDRDALEYLNSLVERLYLNFGITAETELSKLGPEDYPVFDDLYDVVLAEFERTNNDYLRQLLRSLVNYISKFSTGGRNANIWNGPSTITTDENFSVFNFQSLLANRNTTVANAQMLLVLKYIDNEIIKNRDYNLRYNLKRKIVVVIDEAHVFIDTKFPVALDFMFQLAKRIRKYNGMQIVITQNIKDFVGSEEIARKSTAIINACQYSFVFGLAPNDMSDLCRLYEKAGGINEQEQEDILGAKRGQAFAIMGPTSRSSFQVDVPETFVDMFENMDFQTNYFAGEEGREVWEDFIHESRDSHDLNFNAHAEDEAEAAAEEDRDDTDFGAIAFEEDAGDTETFNLGGSGIHLTEETEEEAEEEAAEEEKEEEHKMGAIDKMVAAEEAVNRREYEMAAMRFGGIQLQELSEEEAARQAMLEQEAEIKERVEREVKDATVQERVAQGVQAVMKDWKPSRAQTEDTKKMAAQLAAALLEQQKLAEETGDREMSEGLSTVITGLGGVASGAVTEAGNAAAGAAGVAAGAAGAVAGAAGVAVPTGAAVYYPGAAQGIYYPGAAPGAGNVAPEGMYMAADVDQKFRRLKASMRREMEQELTERLKWITLGAGINGGLQEPEATGEEEAQDASAAAERYSEEPADGFGADPEDGFGDDLEDGFGDDLEDGFGDDLEDDDLADDLEEDDFTDDLEEDDFADDIDEDTGDGFADEPEDADMQEDDFADDLEEEDALDLSEYDEGFDEDLDMLGSDYNPELEEDPDDDFLSEELDILEDEDDDYEPAPFLFAELLKEAAEEYEDMGVEARMDDLHEDVLEVSLDELGEYIRKEWKKTKGE